MPRKLWTKEELILAFALYLRLPFGKMHSRTSEVVELSGLIGRTPSAVAMRLTNFAHIDPYHQGRGIKGLAGGARVCQPIWDEFNTNREDLLFRSELLVAERMGTSIEQQHAKILKDISDLQGLEKSRMVKTRVNQSVFRRIILSNYNNKCAVSGIDIPELLIASHILPWASDKAERLNPANGICLSNLYDKAFDTGLIGIKSDYTIILSNTIKQHTGEEYYSRFFQIEGQNLCLPSRFVPQKEFLQYHMDVIFKG